MHNTSRTLTFVAFALSAINLSAQEKTFEREFTYVASEMDSKVSCRAVAINHLRTELLNEIGVYVENEQLLKSADVEGEFSQDYIENIVTLTAGITKLEVLEERWNGEIFWMKAAITIDKKSLEESLKQLIHDRQKNKEFEALKQELAATTAELDQLKKETESKQNDSGRDEEKTHDQNTQKDNPELNASADQRSEDGQKSDTENSETTLQEMNNTSRSQAKESLNNELTIIRNRILNAHIKFIERHLNVIQKVKKK